MTRCLPCLLMLGILSPCVSLGQAETAVDENRAEVVDEVDEEARVKGGLKTLTTRAKYPDEARQKGGEGRVYVTATVNADGTVREAEVVRGLGAGTDEEALRVVREAEFKPARYNGKKVPARKTVWVQFQK